MDKYYRIAGVVFKLECDENVYDTEETLPFLTAAEKPDFVCRFSFTDDLNIPDTEPEYSSEFVSIYGKGKKSVRTYKQLTMKKTAASVKRDGNIFICECLKEYFDFFCMARNLMNAVGIESMLAEKSRYIIHCSFIELNGQAILFSGPSGMGKSTRAEMWMKADGSRLINGDRAIIFKEEGKWFAAGLPISGSSAVYKNEIVPLKAVVFLKQAKANKTYRANVMTAYGNLFKNLTLNTWNEQFMLNAENFIISMCEDVEMYISECNLDDESVAEQKKTILKQ